MYVVRWHADDREDCKIFSSRRDAEGYFFGVWVQIEDVDGASAALFEVPNTQSAPEAKKLVESADKTVLLLEKRPVHLKLDIKLADLGL